MRNLLLPLALCLASVSASADEALKEFTSDGCSMFPDGTREQKLLWHQCCVVHDLAYWLGGTAEERKDADQALKNCVADVDEPQIAKLMLAGVRVGGTPWLPTRFRWGYGWPWLRGYKVITEEELPMVKEKKTRAAALVEESRLALESMEEEQDNE